MPIWKDENGKTVKVWLWAAWNYVSTAQDRLDKRLDDKELAQDKAIRKALWLEKIYGDFDTLNNIHKKEDWINEAIRIWRRKWYTQSTHFGWDSSFNSAVQAFNDYADKHNIREHVDALAVEAELNRQKDENK